MRTHLKTEGPYDMILVVLPAMVLALITTAT